MKNRQHIIYCIIFIIYFLPYFILGEDFPLDVFDNMNSNIVWTKLAVEHWDLLLTPQKPIPNLLGGEVPFSSIYYNLDIATVFMAKLGYYWGFVVNKMIMALIGYFGTLAMFTSLFKIDNKNIKWLLAMSFSFIPFWGFSIHVIGLPMLAHAFACIYQNKSNFWHWIILVFFAFYSNLVLIGLFTIIICGYILMYYALKNKSLNWPFFWSIGLLSFSYLVSNMPLIYSFLFVDNYISHRVEMIIFSMNFGETMDYLWRIIYKGEFSYHGKKYFLHTLYIIPVIIGTLWLSKKQKLPFVKHLWFYYLISHLLLIITTWKPLVHEFDNLFKIIPVALDRFLWFIPIFWVVQIGLVSDRITMKKPKLKPLFYVLILFQTGIIFYNHKYIVNNDGPSFAQYYSESLFTDVKSYIGEDVKSYKIINVGMEPAVTQYNGFYTLGGFSANYPLAYKHKFRKLIRPELLKEGGFPLRAKFELWGSMCYAFSQDFGRHYGKKYWKPINNLAFNWNIAKEMGAEYVFSPCEIDLDNNPGLSLIKSYKDSKYYYPLRIYKIK